VCGSEGVCVCVCVTMCVRVHLRLRAYNCVCMYVCMRVFVVVEYSGSVSACSVLCKVRNTRSPTLTHKHTQ
jgi:hypothetical protein